MLNVYDVYIIIQYKHKHKDSLLNFLIQWSSSKQELKVIG